MPEEVTLILCEKLGFLRCNGDGMQKPWTGFSGFRVNDRRVILFGGRNN